MVHILCEKCPNTEFFWSIFSCSRTEYGDLRILIIPNKGKYGPEKATYLDTFHAVTMTRLQDATDTLQNSTAILLQNATKG